MSEEDHLPTGGACFIELVKINNQDVLEVLSGNIDADENGHGSLHHARRLREHTDFLNDIPDSALREILQFIVLDGGVMMPSAYDHLNFCVQSIVET